ncbi:hypothetical protein BJY04DRAFT_217136 [Aspergillus karnatakaensis]|uniref:uncharacterized protein n=1 Tax=Aspergillus karnatakaensis TaxID=1810916 RepID=UPI003CCDF0C3
MAAPVGTDPELNEELSTIWAQVHARVLELAGGDEKQVQPLGVKGVLSQLEAAQGKEAAKSEKNEVVRLAFDRTLSIVETVGGVAVGVASQIFGPSELCFNALSFVIQAWKGYQAIFEELATLLSKCAEFLERLEYHIKAKMDKNLSRVAAQHLLLFVEICSRTVRLRSKKSRLKAFSKIFFMQEDSVADLLEQMQRLVDKENRLVGAQTLALAAEAAEASQATLAVTQGLVDTLAGEKDLVAMYRVLLKMLAFDKAKIDERTGEPERSWSNIHRNYMRQRVKGTGEWVFEEPQFQSWYNGTGAAPILALEGKEGSGKSYLASTIISWLKQQRAADGSTKRISTAYYFVEGDSREELKKATNLESVAKSLVWQFAQAERRYLKSVAGICERRGEIDPRNISKDLLFWNEDLAHMDVTFYIVIDGLGDAVGEGMRRFLRRASKPIPGRETRVLVTGDPRCFDQLVHEKDISFSRMAIEQRSAGDVQQYITRRLDEMPALKDTGRRKNVTELRERIKHRLAEQADGDYLTIDQALDTIQQCEYVADINKALDTAGLKRSDQIHEELIQLNEQLTEAEIAEVNEIVRWIVYGIERLTSAQLGAALDLRAGQPSLLPLEDKFKHKYRLFEVDRNGRVDFRSTDIEELIPKGHGHHHSNEQHEKAEDHGITLQESAMVQHFLRTVCPPDVYKRLKLDTFLEQKQQRRKKGSIHCDDQHTGQTLMAMACLRVLTGPDDPQRTLLLPYARSHFVQHLAAVDLALADISAKTNVGSALVKLFTDGETLDTLLENDELITNPPIRWKVRQDWLGSDEKTKEIVRWLSDSAVTAGIADEATQSWLTKVVSGEDHLMKRAAEWTAYRLLQEPHFKPFTRDAFLFVLSYLDKETGDDDVPDVTYTPSIEEVEQVETWCEGVQGKGVKNSSPLWHVQLGTLLRYFKYKPEAEARARQALSLDSQDFRANALLAEVVDAAEGITLLETTLKRLQSDNKWTQDPLNRMELAKMLNTLGVLYWKSEQYDRTVAVCRRALTFDFTDYYRVFEIMQYYGQQYRWADIANMFDVIHQHSTEENNLGEMVEIFADRPYFHLFFLKAIQKTERFDLIETIYGSGISRLTAAEQYTQLSHVRFAYGNALYGVPDRRAEAIKQWEHAIQQDIPRANEHRLVSRLVSKLGPIYVDQAERSDDPAPYLEKISSLVPEGIAETRLGPQIYLARYWYAQGSPEKAKRAVREIVQQAIEFLGDEDSENDAFALRRLLSVFIPLGDDRNTDVCVRALARIEAKVSCEGDCGRVWIHGEDTWWCRDCVNTTFDGRCYQRLCAGKFMFDVCHRGHEFLYIRGRRGETNGEVAIDSKWMDEVRGEYLMMGQS